MRIQYNNIIKAAAAVIAVAGSTACSDTWDDHYAAADNTANGTVWEAMQADNSLTNFTRVVKACNYDLVVRPCRCSHLRTMPWDRLRPTN